MVFVRVAVVGLQIPRILVYSNQVAFLSVLVNIKLLRSKNDSNLIRTVYNFLP